HAVDERLARGLRKSRGALPGPLEQDGKAVLRPHPAVDVQERLGAEERPHVGVEVREPHTRGARPLDLGPQLALDLAGPCPPPPPRGGGPQETAVVGGGRPPGRGAYPSPAHGRPPAREGQA